MADRQAMGASTPEKQPHSQSAPAHTQEALDLLQAAEAQFDQVKEGLAHLQRLSTLGTQAAKTVHELNNLIGEHADRAAQLEDSLLQRVGEYQKRGLELRDDAEALGDVDPELYEKLRTLSV